MGDRKQNFTACRMSFHGHLGSQATRFQTDAAGRWGWAYERESFQPGKWDNESWSIGKFGLSAVQSKAWDKTLHSCHHAMTQDWSYPPESQFLQPRSQTARQSQPHSHQPQPHQGQRWEERSQQDQPQPQGQPQQERPPPLGQPNQIWYMVHSFDGRQCARDSSLLCSLFGPKTCLYARDLKVLPFVLRESRLPYIEEKKQEWNRPNVPKNMPQKQR